MTTREPEVDVEAELEIIRGIVFATLRIQVERGDIEPPCCNQCFAGYVEELTASIYEMRFPKVSTA